MKDIKRTYAIIVAAGKGIRMGCEQPKQLMCYKGRIIIEETVGKFYDNDMVDHIIVVSPSDGTLDDIYRELLMGMTHGNTKPIDICWGGEDREESVFKGLEATLADVKERGLEADEVAVMIHDAVRPGVDDGIIRRNLEALAECRGVVTAIPSVDSVRFVGGAAYSQQTIENRAECTAQNTIDEAYSALKESIEYPIMNSNVVERRYVYSVQTPQTFRLQDIYDAHLKVIAEGYHGTDDASVAEYAGIKVAIVEGASANKKITTAEDLPMITRVGTGYDVHRLVPGRELILCGTPVPYEVGLLGHSDADVATHALMDALLGAAGLGDIGRHFPDTDIRYKGANSMHLLAEVREMLGEYRVVNVDVTIIAEAPKLAPYNAQMRANVARVLGIPESSVNIKATTTEGLGFTGQKEGIAAIATCAIEGRY